MSSMTIAAIATGPAAGGIGVVRLSGPKSLEVAKAVAPDVPEQPSARHAYFTRLVDRQARLLDEGLFLFFAGPSSFTGEDVVELHTHGSPKLLALLLEAVLADDRVRLAEPGEFSRRAFLEGKLDLTRAEAVADLVAAQSERSVRAAAAQLHGVLSRRLDEVRGALVSLRADLEGILDFPEEAEGAEAGLRTRLAGAFEAVRALTAGAREGRLLRRGAKVVLFGPVNAGKSTLFNALLEAERALVDEEPGTTRDVLEAQLEWGGLSCTLVDTAGLRAGGAAGRVEALGIERTRAALKEADLAIWVSPTLEAPPAGLVPAPCELLCVLSKADLGTVPLGDCPRTLTPVSGKTRAGVADLKARLTEKLAPEAAGAVAFVSERHADALRRAEQALERARDAERVSTLEVVSGEVGIALLAIGEVTGENVSAEVLDAIFQRFCIGK